MADFYVDHGAYTSALGTTPTWGVPQEGDGSSKDAATASSVASIVLNMQPDAGDLLTICGLTLGATSGGTYNYTIGGTLTATIDNIVAAINGNAGIGAATVGATVATGTPKVCNLMFARNTGGTTIEIMMRVGSTTLNHATNSNVAISSANWTTPPTITQFIGGTGGCWGWLLNTAAIGVSSSIAVVSYGVMFHKPIAWLATPTENDTIWSRTGSGKTLSYTTSAGTSITLSRAQTWSMRLVFDSNTQWTGDSGTGVVQINLTCVQNYDNVYVYPVDAAVNNVVVAWSAIKQGGLKLRMTVTGNNSSIGFRSTVNYDKSFLITNVDFEDNHADSTQGLCLTSTGYTPGVYTFRNCRFTRLLSSASLPPILKYMGAYFSGALKFFGCSFTWSITGVVNPGPIVLASATVTGPLFVQFSGCTFTGWSGGSNQFTLLSCTAAQPALTVVAEGCTGLALTSAYAGMATTTSKNGLDQSRSGYLLQSGVAGGAFRYEMRNGVVEYDPAASPSFPYLTATQPDGTAYSQRLIWLNNGEVTVGAEWVLPTLEMLYTDTAATRAITLQLFMRTALASALYYGKVAMQVTYIDNATNTAINEFVFVAPVSSAASWTNAGSYGTYAAYKMTLTTANSIKPNTRLRVTLSFSGSPNTGQNESLYLDPEFGVV